MENAKSRVYFADLRAGVKRNLFDKLDALMERVDLKRKFSKGQLIAIKLHFGEKGNTSYIRPNFVRRVVERVKETGAKPFLTDANTLYVGQRGESVSHLVTARENGFDYAVAGAPLIIADGLRGESAHKMQIEGQHFKEVSIGSEIVTADGMVVLTHFKCHEMTGFGGAIKNIGMGCASREGKLAQHSNVAPIGVLKGKEGRAVFVNFITQVSPSCDCYGHTDAPIVPDIGILASDDPVALDQACADLVNMQEGIKNTALESGHEPGGDKFRGVHPEVDWEVQLAHAEKMGLGSRGYELITVL